MYVRNITDSRALLRVKENSFKYKARSAFTVKFALNLQLFNVISNSDLKTFNNADSSFETVDDFVTFLLNIFDGTSLII